MLRAPEASLPAEAGAAGAPDLRPLGRRGAQGQVSGHRSCLCGAEVEGQGAWSLVWARRALEVF